MQEMAKVALEHQTNTAPGMKANLQLDVGTAIMKSEVENILPSPEVKTMRKSRDRGRGTKQEEDTVKRHTSMKQVTSRTETSNWCGVTDALKETSPEKTKQKDNKEMNQMENSELAQNKRVDEGRADMSANGNTGDGGKLESKQEGISEPPNEDKANETQAIEANLETLSHAILEIVHKATEEFKWCGIQSDKPTFKYLTRLADNRIEQDKNRQLSKIANWWTIKLNYVKRLQRARQGQLEHLQTQTGKSKINCALQDLNCFIVKSEGRTSALHSTIQYVTLTENGMFQWCSMTS